MVTAASWLRPLRTNTLLTGSENMKLPAPDCIKGTSQEAAAGTVGRWSPKLTNVTLFPPNSHVGAQVKLQRRTCVFQAQTGFLLQTSWCIKLFPNQRINTVCSQLLCDAGLFLQNYMCVDLVNERFLIWILEQTETSSIPLVWWITMDQNTDFVFLFSSPQVVYATNQSMISSNHNWDMCSDSSYCLCAGLTTEGLYRVCGNKTDQDNLQKLFDQGKTHLSAELRRDGYRIQIFFKYRPNTVDTTE